MATPDRDLVVAAYAAAILSDLATDLAVFGQLEPNVDYRAGYVPTVLDEYGTVFEETILQAHFPQYSAADANPEGIAVRREAEGLALVLAGLSGNVPLAAALAQYVRDRGALIRRLQES